MNSPLKSTCQFKNRSPIKKEHKQIIKLEDLDVVKRKLLFEDDTPSPQINNV